MDKLQKPESSQIYATKPEKGGIWDVAIIGSGPSGLTAAIYTTRGAASTVIFGGEAWGGQLMLTTEVDNWPGTPGIMGPELMAKMKAHATRFGGEFVGKYVESVNFHPSSGSSFELTAGSEKYLARSVIIAAGAETKWLNVPGEEKLRGRGVSSCAPCDAPFFKEKVVAVIGGGDSAMEEALVLTKYASGVTIIHRRSEFRASEAMQKRVMEQVKIGKIKIIWGSEVTEFVGENTLTAVKIKDKDGKESELPIDGAFVAIGHSPSTGLFKDQVELDEKGYVRKMSNKYSTATSVPGVFVAGDVHDFHYKQAITAAGFGCMAGMDSLKYLDEMKVSGEIKKPA